MKSLIRTIIIIAVLIGVGFITSYIVNRNFSSRVTDAQARGLEVGSIQGYETGFLEGIRAGYQEGSKIGYELFDDKDTNSFQEGSFFTYNPTYDEVQEILAENNQTTAMEINNFVEANGIRTAYVRCQIARKSVEGTVTVYNLVAFETTDRGLIFIRPRSHEEVTIQIGKSYSELNGLPPRPYDDTITKITIFW